MKNTSGILQKLFGKTTETFDCPFCKKTVVRSPLFDSKHACDRLSDLQAEPAATQDNATANSFPVDTPSRSNANKNPGIDEIFRLFTTKKNPEIDNMLHWRFSLNITDENYKQQIMAATEKYFSYMGRIDELSKLYGGIVNDCWFFFFREVCALKKKQTLCVKYNEEKKAYQLILEKKKWFGKSEEACLVTMLHPACPHCGCLLPECVSELTDGALLIDLVGDTSTGKTVWQVALAAFLKKKGGSYRISDEYELTYLPEANPDLQERVDAFLSGQLPVQTPRDQTATGRFSSDNGNVFSFNAANTQQANSPNGAKSGAEALKLLLVLKKYNKSGNAVVVRFLNIGDNPGENKADGVGGVSDSDAVRYCNAVMFFVDICETKGSISVVEYMNNPYNTGLPYFGFLIPKADRGTFLHELQNAQYMQFISDFVRVLRFNICSTQENGAAEKLAHKFAIRYMHYSPEELCGALCYYSRERLENSILTGNPNDSVEALYADIVNNERFSAAFTPRDFTEWLRELLTASESPSSGKLFYAENPNPSAQHPVRARDEARRLLTACFLRSIFCPDKTEFNEKADGPAEAAQPAAGSIVLDFERAKDLSSDIGFYPLSSLGKDSIDPKNKMKFNVENWRPYNLFDPILGFLYSYY